MVCCTLGRAEVLGFLVAHGLLFFVVDGWFVSELGVNCLGLKDW